MPDSRFFKETDLLLEVVILLFAAMTMLLVGILLFPVNAGILPFDENGLFGLLLVIFALQTLSMGKTQFGDFQRSGAVLVCGVIIAAIGIITCFIPGIFAAAPRILLIIFFGAGGIWLFLQMLFADEKYRSWRKYGGIFHHLISGCRAVYLLEIVIAILMMIPGRVTTPQMASVAILFGLSLVYLACVLQIICRRYPFARLGSEADAGLSMDHAMLLLTGVFMLFLGLLLVPVCLGLLPFSASGQLGLLMVIFAIQMLATGSTPIGAFPRTWLMVVSGSVFAALGVVSCIIPGILVMPLTFLVGVLNIAGGITGIVRVVLPVLKAGKSSEPAPLILRKINAALLAMNLLTILFGTTMLVSSLIPGLIVGIVLAANGCVLLYLLHQLISLEKIKAGNQQT